MSGINHLYDIYNKKGQEFVDSLFNMFVTINEKMDGSAFTFERDRETGKFRFYRRDQRNPITFVDRTLMKYYEKPIQYIESLPPHIIEKIPRGWRFGLEYFANNKPVEITYDKIPKNHLILSYVHQYGEDGKIKKTIQNKEELDSWADLLGIDRAPIIFQGYLTDDQKSKILEFLRTPFGDLVSRFKTQSFVRFIIGTLNPELKKSALNEDLDKDVEGIVFRFGDPEKEEDPVLAKMVDPVFTQMAKEKTLVQRESKPSDFLGLTLMDVMNFILEKGLDTFRVEGDTEDERYVSFMGSVFSKFLDENGDKYRGTDFEEPEYLKREDFRLNKDLIEDRKVLKYVNEDESFESLFKLMLNSFRKIKTRESGIVTKGMLEQINLLVREIKDYIQKTRKGRLDEGFLSFLEFRKGIEPTVEYLKEEDTETEADENPFYSFKEFISTLETIDNSSPKKKNISEDEKTPDKLKEVNLLMGRFQPFHNGHLKMAKVLKEKNGFPSVIVAVNPGHNKSGKTPFSKDTTEKILKGIVEDEKDIEDFLIVDRGLIGSSIVKLLKKGYRVNLVGAGEDRVNDYTKQIEYVKRSDIKDQMEDLQLVKTPRVTSATEVRQAIKDEDYQKFRKLVPHAVEKMYSALKSEIRGDLDESMEEDFDSSLIIESEIFESSGQKFSPDDLEKEVKKLYDDLINFLQKYKETSKEGGKEKESKEASEAIEEIHEKIARISDIVKKANNMVSKIEKEEGSLQKVISEFVFGEKSRGKRNKKVVDLFEDLDTSTIENLAKRYLEGEELDGLVTIDSIYKKDGGILDIDLRENINGVNRSDIKKIYDFDSGIASGLQQRGKGETLFSILFNCVKNEAAGGDVKSRDTGKIIEIKSSNNAGITPKGGFIFDGGIEILEEASKLFTPEEKKNIDSLPPEILEKIPKRLRIKKNILEEIDKGRIQKATSLAIVEKLKKGGPEAEEVLRTVSEISGIKNPSAEDVIPIFLLLQLDHYSNKLEQFDTLAVFIEKNGAPDYIVIMEAGNKGFVNDENIKIVKRSKLFPKVTSSDRVEIYMSDKKPDKDDE